MNAIPGPTGAAPSRHRWRWLLVLGAAVLGLTGAVLIAEAMGWPFLASPVERYASHKLQRSVSLSSDGAEGFELKLLGGIRLRADRLVIGNASWSQLGPMLSADGAHVALRWRDLLGAGGGRPLPLLSLGARALDVKLERQADGRASWHFVAPDAEAAGAADEGIRGVHIGLLDVEAGRFTLKDAVLALDLDGRIASQAAAAERKAGWNGDATGQFRGLPVKATLRAGAGLSQLALGDEQVDVPVTLDASVGRARLRFDGKVQDPIGKAKSSGNFEVSGPSMAAVGEPLRLTLPTTAAFSMRGTLQHEGTRWTAAVARAQVGRSELSGDFVFDKPSTDKTNKPKLTGELRGKALWLQDLGPAIGAPADANGSATRKRPNRALPDRNFDLPSLQAMQADVRIKLDRLELGHPKLDAVHPLLAHLTLQDGVLKIDAIDAKLARGRITGHVHLDGRQARARWDVDLSARGLEIAQWIAQTRAEGLPPYLAGRLSGRLQLAGTGRSTAELLATSDGRGWLVLARGRISHLAVEVAGLDLAQSLGLMLTGDEALPVTCGAADLLIKKGKVTPQVLVVDTRDSTIWAEGSMSLADEQLDLTVRVEPKDISPLALRSPLRVRGTLLDPTVSIEKGALVRRLVPAVLLGLLNPLAALLPLIDVGDDDAKPAVTACQAVLKRRSRPGDV